MLNPTSLILNGLFSLIGLAYFVYGKKIAEFSFMMAGAGLMIFPYFVSGSGLMLLIGVTLTAAPFVARHYDL